MFRRVLLALGVLALLVPLSSGCQTREPVPWSWPHNKRRVLTILNGLHRFHMDFDRIVFDMEEYPVEPEYN
ncbi:MAG: hypothetical protein ACUVYA_17040 [Planctomycetota bacterium]